jgi:hypothetical protein
MAGTVVADTIRADSTSTLVLRNGVANTPPTIQDNAGTQIGTFCRAWVNFNGTGTVAIRASFNVTSITDNGTGDYTANLTTALSDTNYAVCVTAQVAAGAASRNNLPNAEPITTSTARLRILSAADGSLTDQAFVFAAIFR